MSLDKAIEHGKEKRKPYRGAKAIDPMCRNHGGCPACAKKRQYKIKRREPLEEEEWPNRLKIGTIEETHGCTNKRKPEPGYSRQEISTGT